MAALILAVAGEVGEPLARGVCCVDQITDVGGSRGAPFGRGIVLLVEQ